MARNWNVHYEDAGFTDAAPDPLLIELAESLPAGRALDLACGAGRHAIFLARRGWQVTAVDAAPAGIERLRSAEPGVDAVVGDLERGEFAIEPGMFDLICDFYYLQRDLFPAIREGVRPGGTFVGAVHLSGSFAMGNGELCNEFAGWKIGYYSEAAGSAKIIARRA